MLRGTPLYGGTDHFSCVCNGMAAVLVYIEYRVSVRVDLRLHACAVR